MLVQRVVSFIDINFLMLLTKFWDSFVANDRDSDLWISFVLLHATILVWIVDDVRDYSCYQAENCPRAS